MKRTLTALTLTAILAFLAAPAAAQWEPIFVRLPHYCCVSGQHALGWTRTRYALFPGKATIGTQTRDRSIWMLCTNRLVYDLHLVQEVDHYRPNSIRYQVLAEQTVRCPTHRWLRVFPGVNLAGDGWLVDGSVGLSVTERLR